MRAIGQRIHYKHERRLIQKEQMKSQMDFQQD